MTMVRNRRTVHAVEVMTHNGTQTLTSVHGSARNTGMYFTGTQIFFAAQGTIVARVDNNSLTMVTGGMQLILDNGTALAPAFRFAGATGTGMFKSGTADLGLAVGGVERAVLTAAGMTLAGALTVDSAVLIATTTPFTDGAGVGLGTLTNAPTAGDPTKWIPVDDNGTTRHVPAW